MLRIGGQDGEDYLYVVVNRFGDEGSDGAVGQPAGQDGLLTRPSLPPEKAAWDLSSGVETFLIFHRQGQEVDIGTGLVRHYGGDQHNSVAPTYGDRAVRLQG